MLCIVVVAIVAVFGSDALFADEYVGFLLVATADVVVSGCIIIRPIMEFPPEVDDSRESLRARR